MHIPFLKKKALQRRSIPGVLVTPAVSNHGQGVKGSINDLPDEILEMVLNRLSPPTPAFDEEDGLQPTTELWDYCNYLKVCSRWRRIYEPIFYYFPNLGRIGWNIPHTTHSLLTTLKSRPDLCSCIQRLHITPRASSQEVPRNQDTIVEIIELCKPSLRSVLLHTNWETQFAWALVLALQDHQLHTLEILGTKDGIGIQTVISYLDCPTLRALRLRRYSCLDGEVDSAPGIRITHHNPDSRTKLLDELTRRATQGSVTSLVLNHESIFPRITRALIAWPARLVELELTGLYESGSAYTLTHKGSEVRQMLEPHRESLEVLRLGIERRYLDFAQFAKLRRLRLASQNLFEHDPDDFATRLKPPNLKQLDVAFYLIRPFSRGLTPGFGLTHKQWLITFARKIAALSVPPPSDPPAYSSLFPATPSSPSSSEDEASSEEAEPSSSEDDVADASTFGQQTQGGLETISISFFPRNSSDDIKEHFLYPSSADSESEASRPWPWLHMKDAAKAVKPLGAKVLFEPCIPKQEWHDLVKQKGSRSWMG